MLDTIREVSTPELIELRLRCAGPFPRALAWLIDFIIRVAVAVILFIVLTLLFAILGTELDAAQIFGGMWLIVLFLVEWLYPVPFEVLGGGRTPGKRVCGLQVVSQDGSPVGWGASLARNLLRAVDFMPFLYGLGLFSMLFSREFRRIGDVVAGTLVVYRREHEPPPVLPDVPVWRPTQPLSRHAQRAVIDFAERAVRLSDERQEELAEHVPNLTGGAHGREAVRRLLGLARLLLGRNG